MARDWTFGRRLAAGFAAMVLITVTISAVSVYALRSVVDSKDRIIAVNARNLTDAQALGTTLALKIAAIRSFLLAKEDRYTAELDTERAAFATILGRLRAQAESAADRQLLDAIGNAQAEHRAASDRLLALRRTDATTQQVSGVFDTDLAPKAKALTRTIDAYVAHETAVLQAAREQSSRAAGFAMSLVVAFALAAVVLATALATLLARLLGRQIGTAVGHVQSSSSELQAAATQQASGAKEQATAMSEIATTIRELLATSRQIAESSQRVAQVAGETAGSAGAGERTVDAAHESIAGIRRQVDLVVTHMLDLGRKSQQIGAVLEIVTELAEQTNILSINATIEAAGAGESGARFGAVADEIRKLAERVGGSTKEIRGLIEDVRAAVNTTVMATEGGSKAVDSGSRQFTEVASSFKQIAGLVSTTTEAAREIELSTKQQSTAVEQVNVAIANVAQATRETEASSSQTLQTASQLAELSRELGRLIRPEARSG